MQENARQGNMMAADNFQVTTNIIRFSDKDEMDSFVAARADAMAKAYEKANCIFTFGHGFHANERTARPDFIRNFLKAARRETLKFRFFGAAYPVDDESRIQCLVAFDTAKDLYAYDGFVSSFEDALDLELQPQL